MPPKSKQIERLSPFYEYEAVDHFTGGNVTGGALNLAGGAAGGAGSFVSGGVNTPGIVRLGTGVTATGSYVLRGLPTALWMQPNTIHNYRCRFRYRLATSPVSTTEGCVWVCGFGNSNFGGEPAAGAYLYIDSVDGMQYFVCRNPDGRTAIPNVLQPVNKWLECYITLQRNGVARFDIQDAEESTNFTTVLISNNFPTVGVNACFGLAKTAGTVARSLDLDYVAFGFNSLTPIA